MENVLICAAHQSVVLRVAHTHAGTHEHMGTQGNAAYGAHMHARSRHVGSVSESRRTLSLDGGAATENSHV